MKHLVIGHDQILCCEETTGPVGVEIGFIHVSGTIHNIVERVRREMNLSRDPLAISAMLFLDSLSTLTMDGAKSILEEIKRLATKHPHHRLFVGEALYAPAFRARYRFIAALNELVKETNKANGNPYYSISNVGAKRKWNSKKGQWDVIEARSHWSSDGRLLASQKTRKSYLQFIQKFHTHWTLPAPASTSQPSPDIEVEEIITPVVPNTRARDPGSAGGCLPDQVIWAEVLEVFQRDSRASVAKAFDNYVQVVDLRRLREGNWLNDNLINFYLAMLAEAYDDVFVFPTFFMTYLLHRNFEDAKKWSRLPEVNILNYRLLIVPVHLKSHWILLTVNNVARTFSIYDSLGDQNLAVGVAMLHVLEQEVAAHGERPRKYRLVEPGDIPQQTNTDDCGVFVLLYARKILRGQPIQTIKVKEITMSRMKIAWEIANLASLKEPKEEPKSDVAGEQEEQLLLEDEDDEDLVLQVDEAELMDLLV